MPDLLPAGRHRFEGRIAGAGSTSGVRVVVGWWHETPWGRFADAMVEDAAGHRALLAPDERVAWLLGRTYVFDEVRVEPVRVAVGPRWWSLAAPSLGLDLTIGGRLPLGRLLRAVPGAVGTSTAYATIVDPIARVALRGVRTRGAAREGAREWYAARDLRAVTGLRGTWAGVDLGDLAPVAPPCRFGFSSVPRRPSVTDVVTTIEIDPH